MSRWFFAAIFVALAWYTAETQEPKTAIVFLASVMAIAFIGVDTNLRFLGELIDKINDQINTRKY